VGCILATDKLPKFYPGLYLTRELATDIIWQLVSLGTAGESAPEHSTQRVDRFAACRVLRSLQVAQYSTARLSNAETQTGGASTTPSPHPAQSPSRKSSPIQKFASALISLPVVFTRDPHRGQSSTAPPLGAEPTTESPIDSIYAG
jgi:hypothetical protein